MIRLFGLAGLVFLLFCLSVGLSFYVQGLQNAAAQKAAHLGSRAPASEKSGQGDTSQKTGAGESGDKSGAKGADQGGLVSVFGEGKRYPGTGVSGGNPGANGNQDPVAFLRSRQLEWIQLDLRGEQMMLERLQKQLEEENRVLLDRIERFERTQKRKDDDLAKSQARQPILSGGNGNSGKKEDQPPLPAGSPPRMTGEGDREEQGRVRQVAAIYESMAPDHAAKILTQMADSGNLDMAAQILALIKDRHAARILAEMHDPSLGAQLLEKIKGLRQQGGPDDSSRIRDRMEKRTNR